MGLSLNSHVVSIGKTGDIYARRPEVCIEKVLLWMLGAFVTVRRGNCHGGLSQCSHGQSPKLPVLPPRLSSTCLH